MDNVIQLNIKRRQYNDCEHMRVIIPDDEQDTVECKDCGAKLTPMAILKRLVHEESRFTRERKKYLQIVKLLEKKEHTKCKHCGKMTKVNVKLTGVDL